MRRETTRIFAPQGAEFRFEPSGSAPRRAYFADGRDRTSVAAIPDPGKALRQGATREGPLKRVFRNQE